VEEMKEVEMMAKMKLFKPKVADGIYRRGSTKLEGNRGIKSLPSLEIFSEWRPYGPYVGTYGLYALCGCGMRLGLGLWSVNWRENLVQDPIPKRFGLISLK
jgi:hypothetical protein